MAAWRRAGVAAAPRRSAQRGLINFAAVVFGAGVLTLGMQLMGLQLAAQQPRGAPIHRQSLRSASIPPAVEQLLDPGAVGEGSGAAAGAAPVPGVMACVFGVLDTESAGAVRKDCWSHFFTRQAPSGSVLDAVVRLARMHQNPLMTYDGAAPPPGERSGAEGAPAAEDDPGAALSRAIQHVAGLSSRRRRLSAPAGANADAGEAGALAACQRQRYMIYVADRQQSGLGWSFHLHANMFINALLTKRIFVEAAALFPDVPSKWCGAAPQSLKCFFRPWSQCEALGLEGLGLDRLDASGAERSGAQILRGLPRCPYRSTDNFAKRSKARVCVAREADLRFRSQEIFLVDRDFDDAHRTGRAFWYAVAAAALFNPRERVAEAADALARRGAPAARPAAAAPTPAGGGLLLVHARLGNKSTEEATASAEHYAALALNESRRMGAAGVILQTETERVVELLRAADMGAAALVVSNNSRSGADTWARNAASPQELTREGAVAAVNYALAAHADALVGTLGSAWLKLVVGIMYWRRGARPFRILTVAEPHFMNNIFGRDAQGAPVDDRFVEHRPFGRRAPIESPPAWRRVLDAVRSRGQRAIDGADLALRWLGDADAESRLGILAAAGMILLGSLGIVVGTVGLARHHLRRLPALFARALRPAEHSYPRLARRPRQR